MRLICLIALFLGIFSFNVHAERIKLKSGRVFEAEILQATEDFIEIKFYGTAIRFYRHEIASIGDDVPEPTQKALTKALYAIYQSSQTALDREDKEAYKSTLTASKAFQLEREQDSFFESLKLLKQLGMDPKAPKIPEFVAEYEIQAVLILSDPLVQTNDYFSIEDAQSDVAVTRVVFKRENNGWKIDSQENFLKPSWMSYELFELARRPTSFESPKKWGRRFADDSDENPFKYSDVSALEFADDGKFLYIKITFDKPWTKELLNFNIYFNTNQSDLTWYTSHDNFEDISGWQYKIMVGSSNGENEQYPLAYSVLTKNSKKDSAKVFFEQSNGWIVDQGDDLIMKVPLEVIELDRNTKFKFAIVDSS